MRTDRRTNLLLLHLEDSMTAILSGSLKNVANIYDKVIKGL
jgi:hypothetical protein